LFDPGHDTVIGRADHGIRQIQIGPIEHRLRLHHHRVLHRAADPDCRRASPARCRPLLRRIELRLRQLQRVLHLLELRARTDTRDQQPLLALILVLLVGQRVARGHLFGQLVAVGRLGGADLHARRGQLGLRLLDRDAKHGRRAGTAHRRAAPLIVMHVEFDHASGHVGADRGLRGLHR
jgi:hypothetical protein